MNIESVREYCLSLPLVTEAFPFDERTFILSLIRHSYSEVVKKRKKKERLEHPEITEVKE